MKSPSSVGTLQRPRRWIGGPEKETWFAWQDTDDKGACAFCEHAGLVTLDRQEKPALGAFRRVATGG